MIRGQIHKVKVNLEREATEKTVSEEKETMKIATIAAVAKAIKDNSGHRQFRYNGKEDNNKVCGFNAICKVNNTLSWCVENKLRANRLATTDYII